jgi:hypothetical protein
MLSVLFAESFSRYSYKFARWAFFLMYGDLVYNNLNIPYNIIISTFPV